MQLAGEMARSRFAGAAMAEEARAAMETTAVVNFIVVDLVLGVWVRCGVVEVLRLEVDCWVV